MPVFKIMAGQKFAFKIYEVFIIHLLVSKFASAEVRKLHPCFSALPFASDKVVQ